MTTDSVLTGPVTLSIGGKVLRVFAQDELAAIGARQAELAGKREDASAAIRASVEQRTRSAVLHMAAAMLSDVHVSRGAQRALQALVVWCRGGRAGHPSNAQLGADSNYSARSITNHMRELRTAGIVELVERGGGRCGKRAGRANRWRITELGWAYLGIQPDDGKAPRRASKKPRKNCDTLVSIASQCSSPLPPKGGDAVSPGQAEPEQALPLVASPVEAGPADMSPASDDASPGAAAPLTPLGAGTADRPSDVKPRPRGRANREKRMQVSGGSVNLDELRARLVERAVPEDAITHALDVVRGSPRVSHPVKYALTIAQGFVRRREAGAAHAAAQAAAAERKAREVAARRAAAPPVAAPCDDVEQQRAHARRLDELERGGHRLALPDVYALRAARALGWLTGTPSRTASDGGDA